MGSMQTSFICWVYIHNLCEFQCFFLASLENWKKTGVRAVTVNIPLSLSHRIPQMIKVRLVWYILFYHLFTLIVKCSENYASIPLTNCVVNPQNNAWVVVTVVLYGIKYCADIKWYNVYCSVALTFTMPNLDMFWCSNGSVRLNQTIFHPMPTTTWVRLLHWSVLWMGCMLNCWNWCRPS